jgi:hypothetical protein
MKREVCQRVCGVITITNGFKPINLTINNTLSYLRMSFDCCEFTTFVIRIYLQKKERVHNNRRASLRWIQKKLHTEWLILQKTLLSRQSDLFPIQSDVKLLDLNHINLYLLPRCYVNCNICITVFVLLIVQRLLFIGSASYNWINKLPVSVTR